MRISPKQFLQGLLYAAPIMLLALASCGGGGGGGTAAPTTPVVAPSTAPTGLAATTGCSAINLKWSSVAGATGYYVYHAASGFTATKTLANTNSYTDAGLLATTTYNYQVAAANSAGEGPKSNPAVSKATGAACTSVGGSVQSTTPLALSITSTVSTIAGAELFPGYVNSTNGLNARFDLPANVATDGTNLYLADSANNAIRKIVISTGAVSTFAGSLTGASGVANLGTVSATIATFNGPQGITTLGTNLYVADTKNNAIRQIAIPGGAVSTIATTAFNSPAAITTDGTYLYVADTLNDQIVQLNLDGTTTGNANVAVISPQGITYNSGNSDLYVTGASGISQIVDMGAVGMGAPSNLNVGGLYAPQGITTDGTYLYVTNSSIGTIIRVTLPAPTATDTIAGTGTLGYKDGTAGAAQFRSPYGITTDGINLYIVDTGNSSIRKIQ